MFDDAAYQRAEAARRARRAAATAKAQTLIDLRVDGNGVPTRTATTTAVSLPGVTPAATPTPNPLQGGPENEPDPAAVAARSAAETRTSKSDRLRALHDALNSTIGK